MNILFNYHRWPAMMLIPFWQPIPLSNLYMYLLCSDMVNKLLSLPFPQKVHCHGKFLKICKRFVHFGGIFLELIHLLFVS